MAIVESGTLDQLERLAVEINGFPNAVDSFVGRRWIINAIGTGSAQAIRWMLGKRVDLNFRDDESYTPSTASSIANAKIGMSCWMT